MVGRRGPRRDETVSGLRAVLLVIESYFRISPQQKLSRDWKPMEPFIGMIVGFGGNFAPRGWALCDGQLLAIASNSALFSILGTTYGGDGRTTFGLPDLRGRAVVHAGHGPGLSSVRLGEKGGAETVTLTVQQLPSHNHTATLHGETATPTASNPQDKMLALAEIYADVIATDDRTFAPQSIQVQNTGGNQPVPIRSPYQAVNVIIALQGLFPSRS